MGTLWLDEHPDETCVVIALSQNAVIALLSPDNNVVSVQHIRDEYLDERLAIAVDVLSQGGDYSGTGLAGAIDDYPLAASTTVGGYHFQTRPMRPRRTHRPRR